MGVDIFSREDFEKVLPIAAKGVGIIMGEYTYHLPIDETYIEIRSSIDKSEFSAESGQDSIRAWLMSNITQKPVAYKITQWTTRKPGWEVRLIDNVVSTLILWRLRAGNCKKCGQPNSIFKSSSGKNPNRPYAKCLACNSWVAWLDAPILSSEQDCICAILNGENISTKIETKEKEMIGLLDMFGDQVAIHEPEQNESAVFEPYETVSQSEKYEINLSGNPNTEQQAVIDEPAGTNLRIMAPPGSGKTFTAIRRYVKLITESGVPPERILLVTFTKKMADEMLAKILKTVPDLAGTQAARQVCTIHALCHRIQKENGDNRQLAKEWQIKKAIQEIAEKLWEKNNTPGYEEIKFWIDLAKNYGYSSSNDENYFSRYLGGHARRLHESRRLFDAEMKRQNLKTFPDMLYEVEQKLATSREFRSQYQGRFDEVIVDEAQDTNQQALRILITLSLKPGENKVYEDWKN